MPTFDVYVAVKLTVATEKEQERDKVSADTAHAVREALEFTYRNRGFQHDPLVSEEPHTQVGEVKVASCLRTT